MNDTSYIEPLTDGDFTELLIRHMILSPEVYKRAKALHVSGEDMMLDDVFGNELYREIVNIINSVTSGDITPMSVVNGLKARFDSGVLNPNLSDSAYALLEYFFDTNRPLENPTFFDGKLTEFLKKRRAKKIIEAHSGDVTLLTAELNKLSMTLNNDKSTKPRILHPFRDLIIKVKTNLIGTGLRSLDRKVNGLMLGEYALLVGYSGGGKTALGVNMAGKLAESGMPSVYISCEEAEEMLAQRFYAHSFDIRYGNLRDGEANFELEAKFRESLLNEQKIQKLRDNLCLFGLKGIDTITPEFLHSVLVQHYENTGFVPKFIMLDQMQFITPDTQLRKSTPPWELEKAVSAELDELSHRKVGNTNFVLWVQHQAKGKVRASFTREEIDGFKGIIHKADLALGIGRAHAKADQVHLFSLKTRHCEEFSSILKCQLEYMRILDVELKDTLPDVAKRQEADTMTQVALT